jgi:hypothetical protein
MTLTEEERLERQRRLLEEALAKELADAPDGVLPPPWIRYPDYPAGLICWRMGDGEWFLMIWHHWSEHFTEAQRLDYFRRFAPLPLEWADWVACSFVPESEELPDDPEPAVARLSEAGLIDLEAWRRYWHEAN